MKAMREVTKKHEDFVPHIYANILDLIQIPGRSTHINTLLCHHSLTIACASMVPVLKVLLFLTLHLLQDVKSSKVHLNNNGYEGVVIAINPSVPEDERLIPSLKVRRIFITCVFSGQ